MKKGAARAARTRCGGRWTEARYRAHIINALRSASTRWAPKHDCINSAFVRQGPNPATGRMCKLHRCTKCRRLFPKNQMRADHVEPVVDPARGFTTWDDYIARMFVEQDGYQAICIVCHKGKTDTERKIRDGKLSVIPPGAKRRQRAPRSPQAP